MCLWNANPSNQYGLVILYPNNTFQVVADPIPSRLVACHHENNLELDPSFTIGLMKVVTQQSIHQAAHYDFHINQHLQKRAHLEDTSEHLSVGNHALNNPSDSLTEFSFEELDFLGSIFE